MPSKKVWIVSLSIAAHAAVFTTAFITNAWRVERLDPERQRFSLAVLPPPPAPSGGPQAGQKPKDPPPPPRKVVTGPSQPPEKPTKPPTPVVASDDGGGGQGNTKGPGDNPDGDPADTGSCTGPACGPATAPPAEKPPVVELPPVVETPIVPPSTLRRLSGETAIAPSDVIKTQMLRDGHRRVVGSFKICLSEAGRVTSIGTVGSTRYPEYDQKLMTAMRGWAYAPYLIQGRPAPVCSAVSFVYTME